MAKGKHAVALFEVIHSARKPQGQSPQGLFRTPKWWFNGRARAADRRTPAAPAPAEPNPAAEPIAAVRPASSSPAAPASATARQQASAARGIDLDVNRDHKQITFRVSFHSAIVTTFAVLMVVVIAYAIGRRMSSGPAAATAGVTSEQLRSGPPRPDVLSVTTPSAEQRTRTSAQSLAPQTTPPPPPTATPVPTPAPAAPTERVIGMQYVVIQSFLGDTAAAEKTATWFKENGIECTVENGLPGWGPRWYSVVGTQGFPRASGIEYERYFNRVLNTADKYAAARKLPPFKPLAVAWKSRSN